MRTHERHHPSSNADHPEMLNFFDEGVFAHNTNGTVLAVHPAHISLSESRSLGSIPATVRTWEIRGTVSRVILIVADRTRETVFCADLPAGHPLSGVLRNGLLLYMRFAWDKVMEWTEHCPPTRSLAAA